MTLDSGSRGLRFLVEDAFPVAKLVDVRCGRCAACRTGRDYWCLEGRESGPVLAEIGVGDGDAVRRWTSALGALAVARPAPGAPLLVLSDAPTELVTRVVKQWHDGPVVVASDARDPKMRHQLARLSGTGRAPVVLTVTDVRGAVRAVERGGQVCAPDAVAALPSVTELVQRDVTLVAARGVDALVEHSSWLELGASLTALLDAGRVAGANR